MEYSQRLNEVCQSAEKIASLYFDNCEVIRFTIQVVEMAQDIELVNFKHSSEDSSELDFCLKYERMIQKYIRSPQEKSSGPLSRGDHGILRFFSENVDYKRDPSGHLHRFSEIAVRLGMRLDYLGIGLYLCQNDDQFDKDKFQKQMDRSLQKYFSQPIYTA